MKLFFWKTISGVFSLMLVLGIQATEPVPASQATNGPDATAMPQKPEDREKPEQAATPQPAEKQKTDDMAPALLEEMMAMPSDYQERPENQTQNADPDPETGAVQEEDPFLFPSQEPEASQQQSEPAEGENTTPAAAFNQAAGEAAIINVSTVPFSKTEPVHVPGQPQDPEDEKPDDIGDRHGGSHKGVKFLDIPIIRMGETGGPGSGFKVIKAWND